MLIILLVLTGMYTSGCKQNSAQPTPGVFQLVRIAAGETSLSTTATTPRIPVSAPFVLEFTSAVDTTTAKNAIRLHLTTQEQHPLPVRYQFSSGDQKVTLIPLEPLDWLSGYSITISETLRARDAATFPGTQVRFTTENGTLSINAASINGASLTGPAVIRNVAYDQVQITLTFTHAVLESDLRQHLRLEPQADLNIGLSPDGRTVTIDAEQPLDYYTPYIFSVSTALKSAAGFDFAGFVKGFSTGLDPRIKKPHLDDESLLDLVQEATFQYFWDFAHPVSGMARERTTSGELVTMGGSGFGVMAILVGVERGFITRAQAIERFQKITTFLTNADRFHGVWPHWLHGSTGRTIPFSTNDNGGDLVETSFMAQGLITVREYMDASNPTEQALITTINQLLDTIEWDWYTRNQQSVLYWHWSADRGWAMNMQVRGYNEALITYFMAATSKQHRISAEVYHNGWAGNGGIRNGKTFYGYSLPVGFDYGGPLFFAHYSFLGLDPRGLSDRYADYWVQNRHHTLINRAHSLANPFNRIGYSADAWGLTASDDHTGYGVHEPTRDNGTITPTAALSSMPYTPAESMQALRHFYFVLGDKLWGEYGFYDAYNPTQGWWSNQHLAIDQGPIVVMIENHRSALLWNLFMQAPEVQDALEYLDFNRMQP